MVTLDVFNTHMELYPYKQFDQLWLEKQYTAIDKFTNTEYACGYIINDNKMYLPRGTSISKLKTVTGCNVNEITDSDPSEMMSRRHSAYYEPRNKLQSDSIDFLKGEGHQLGLNLKTGFGKAVPMSTKIPAPRDNGYLLMRNAKLGDYVFDENGNPTKIIGVFPQGKKDIYKMTFDDGRYALCCEEHLWQVIDENNESKVMMTKDIMESNQTYYIPTSNAVNYAPRGVRFDPYSFGVLITSTTNKYCRELFSPNGYVPKKVSKNMDIKFFHLKKLFGDKYFFKLNGKLNTYILEKRIPFMYKYNDVNIRMELLQGVFDTCGEILYSSGEYKIRVALDSVYLLQDIAEIIWSLGYIARINEVNKYVIIDIPNKDMHRFFTDPALLKRINYFDNEIDKNDFSKIKINGIYKEGNTECQCIKVENPSGLFLTEKYIVTHNTFCVAYASTELQKRTLIITPNTGLKTQWIKTYSSMFDYKPKELMDISGSNVMEAILEKSVHEADVYFVNHQTIRSFLATYGPYKTKEFFEKLGAGIKVYDESHMEFSNILLIDFLSNTDKTWYLTATFDRSDKTESACFKRAFQSVDTFGKTESEERTKKHVIYHIVNINSNIDQRNRAKLLAYPGFQAAKYGHYAIFDDKNDTAYKTILALLNKTTDMEGKILIFIPLIDAVDEVVKRLKRDYPLKSVAAYHSKIDKHEKEAAEKKDIIVSTIRSCGTGRDIKGLRCVICLEPVCSKVVTEQTIGRLRPYADDKDTYFFDIVSRDIPAINWWFRARFKTIQRLVKSVIEINDVLE